MTDVEPAHIDQLLHCEDGDWVLIDADVGGVVAALQAHDPTLRVRFNKRGHAWVIYQDLSDGGPRHDELILAVNAEQGPTGAWSGLDQRIVDRVMLIDSHGTSGYDFAKELERANAANEKAKADRRSERLGEMGEQLRHALRKDLGVKNRAFIR
jgi:hypothetical protein